ncbi:MAG: STAS domain-containing protein, partial [Pseudobdellovibrionaceae bacterium]
LNSKIYNHGYITVVALSGKIDVEKSYSFSVSAKKNFPQKNVIFCMQNVNFVGSSGIQAFFQTLEVLQTQLKSNILIAGLHPDFEKILRFTAKSELKVYDTLENALTSFHLSHATFESNLEIDLVASKDSQE